MDGDVNTLWHCNQYGPCRVGFDLQSSRNVIGVKLLSLDDRVSSAFLQYSADGTSWSNGGASIEITLENNIQLKTKNQTACELTSCENNKADVYFFNKAENNNGARTARFWRLDDIRGNSGYPALAEVSFTFQEETTTTTTTTLAPTRRLVSVIV